MDSNKSIKYGEQFEDIAAKIYTLKDLETQVKNRDLSYDARCAIFHRIWVLKYSINELKKET